MEFRSDLREMFQSGVGCDSYNILPSPGECHLLLMSPFTGKASLQVQHEAPTPKGCARFQTLPRVCSVRFSSTLILILALAPAPACVFPYPCS